MTRRVEDFLSLKAHKVGSVSFGNGKKRYIFGIGKVGKSVNQAIDNMKYMYGLKYSLLSVL